MFNINKHPFQIILFCFILFQTTCTAQQTAKKPITRALLVFDCSKSMVADYNGQPRMDVAKQLLYQLVDSLQKIDHIELALRMYGFQTQYPPGDCKDTRLIVPFSKSNGSQIKNKVKAISPTGITPIAHSLNESANDFPESPGINMIILITDGIEECDGDPCEASKNLQKKGIILKPFIVGIGLDAEKAKAFDCVGSYFDITSNESFNNVLNIIIYQTLNPTTVQVNLLSAGGTPSETDVNMTFYNQYTGNIKYNYIHTINNKGNPDTIEIDPLGFYKIVTHTLPPVEADSIKFVLGKHNTVAIDAPQGYLQLVYGSYTTYKQLQCIVRKSGEMRTLHVQDFNNTEKFIVGNYDLEILTLPRIHINNVPISQSTIKTVEVPRAGTVKIYTGELGNGSICLERNNKLEWVCNLSNSQTVQTFNIQPGNYRVEFLPKSKKESIYTVERRFTVKSDDSQSISLF